MLDPDRISSVPVQSEASVHVPAIGPDVNAPFTSKVPEPVTLPLPSRVIWVRYAAPPTPWIFSDEGSCKSVLYASQTAGDDPACEGKTGGDPARVGVDDLGAFVHAVENKLGVCGPAAREVDGEASGAMRRDRICAGVGLCLDDTALTHGLRSGGNVAVAIGVELTDGGAHDVPPLPGHGGVSAGSRGRGADCDEGCHYCDSKAKFLEIHLYSPYPSEMSETGARRGGAAVGGELF